MRESNIEKTRNVAIVGPYASGKTSLLESILYVTGKISRKGSVKDKNTIGDSSPEAKEHHMSTEVTVAGSIYQEIDFTFLDCPGSIEFAQETYNALVGAGCAVVVCEAVKEKVLALAPLLKFLDDWEIPHMVFINKLDHMGSEFMEVLHALNTVSARPLLPRQYPIVQEQTIVGYIDLITEQAYHYHPNSPADPVPLPIHLQQEEKAARNEMLETLADFDDHLLQELLDDVEPPQEEILQDLKQNLQCDRIVPVFFGIAEQDYGVRPLLNALIKEAPAPTVTAARRGLSVETDSETLLQVLKTYFTPQGGRLSLVRVWLGELKEGAILNGVRAGGIYRMMGAQTEAITSANRGEIVAISRLEGIITGATLATTATPPVTLAKAETLVPVYALALTTVNHKDDVKVSNALNKLCEEDNSLKWQQHDDTHEVILWGQGEIHLRVALEKLRRKYNLPMTTHLPQVAYKETIRKETTSHGRYKHQTGGHGAFGDVYLQIKPLARGKGFQFHETIVGGVVPRQYIPGVETGVREYLSNGPLGFPVVDVDVTLTNGSYHSVDSSEQAFKQAARLAMSEGMPKCSPVLLEPILRVRIAAPSEFTNRVLQLLSGHRAQILGYQTLEAWKNWDEVSAYLPQAQMQDFIIELRSLTLGVGFFKWDYDHLQEVSEKLTAEILAHQENP